MYAVPATSHEFGGDSSFYFNEQTHSLIGDLIVHVNWVHLTQFFFQIWFTWNSLQLLSYDTVLVGRFRTEIWKDISGPFKIVAMFTLLYIPRWSFFASRWCANVSHETEWPNL